MTKYLGYALIFIGLVTVVSVSYLNSKYRTTTRPFSNYTLLSSSWGKYKEQYINQDGRVVDYGAGDVTTSEGQSYAMLRAVFIDDRKGFDLVWKWTKENLQKRGDALFGWQWGKRNDGNYGFLDDGGNNSASDADGDIALALILADRRWKDERYTQEAKKILKDMWEKETAVTKGKRYLVAGNWATTDSEMIVNPSYLAPYQWRIFDEVDEERKWSSLIDPAYELLLHSGNLKLDKEQGIGLPPNWLLIDRKTGEMRAPNLNHLDTNYGFDAIRVPWRIALDYEWSKESKAREYLAKSYSFLEQAYTDKGKLPTLIAHNGEVINDKESPAMYATALGYFMIQHPEMAVKIYQDKIIRLYSNDSNSFKEDIPYYEQNWLWFGAGLYTGQLQNFSSSNETKTEIQNN